MTYRLICLLRKRERHIGHQIGVFINPDVKRPILYLLHRSRRLHGCFDRKILPSPEARGPMLPTFCRSVGPQCTPAVASHSHAAVGRGETNCDWAWASMDGAGATKCNFLFSSECYGGRKVCVLCGLSPKFGWDDLARRPWLSRPTNTGYNLIALQYLRELLPIFPIMADWQELAGPSPLAAVYREI